MSTRGTRIKQALRARGIRKQHALASALKVHESAITRWKEDGNMSLENAIALCQELDVSADWLLLGIGHMDQHKTFPLSTVSRHTSPADSLSELQSLLTQQSMNLLLSFIKSITE
jgi:transcriptional regulator with XRE-family HTH domain